MPSFGDKSSKVRATLHSDLVIVVDEAIKVIDFSLIQGRRSNEEQAALYAIGRTVKLDKEPVTRTKPGESTHCPLDPDAPSDAFDFIPYPFNGWDDVGGFALRAGIFLGIAEQLYRFGQINSRFRWGNDWDGDGTLVAFDADESLIDAPHIERIV